MSMDKATRGLSKEEIDHIAWLSRVELSEEEKKLFAKQFDTIIDYFHILDEVDAKDIKPTSHVLDVTNVFREDKVECSLPVNDALANAPRKEKGFFKAPKIV